MYSSGRLSPQALDSTDRKDLTISRLKAEANELQRTQNDFVKLSSELTHLERKFKALSEEKTRNESLFVSKHELNQQTIVELKSELGQLKVLLKDRSAEYEMLKAQKEIKNREILNFQEKVGGIVHQMNEEKDQERVLEAEIKKLQAEIAAIDNEKGVRKYRKADLRREVEVVAEKNQEVETLCQELHYEQGRISKLIAQQEAENSNISLDIEAKDQKLKFLNQKNKEGDESLISLMEALEEKRVLKERLLLDIKMSEKTQKNEYQRGEELNAKLARLEQTQEKKQEEIQRSKNKFDEEHKKIESMQSLIEQLNKDREVLKLRLEGLNNTKSKIFSELQRVDQENDQIYNLLTNPLTENFTKRELYSVGSDNLKKGYRSSEKSGSLRSSKLYPGE